MNFLNRLKVAFKLAFNRYEGGQTYSPNRSWIPASVHDARFDATAAARTEIMRKARYFERNNAIAQRAGSVFVDYTVGANGMPVTPASSNPKWNENSKKNWQSFCQFPDLTSRQNFGVLQGLIAWRWFFDGEIFILKTRGQDASGTWRPRVQLIESHLIGTPPDMAEQEGKTVVDGIAIDPNTGRPTGYWARKDSSSETYRLIDAKNIIHVFEPSRPGEYRGISFFHAVINELHDLDDLELLEGQAAKRNAADANIIQTESGEVDADELMRSGGAVADLDGKKRGEYYENLFGASARVLRHGDKLLQNPGERPSVTTRDYWEYKINKVCIGLGFSKQLVFPYSIQGTIGRADLDVSNVFFKSRSSVLAAAFREIYIYVTGWGIRTDVSLNDPVPPPDWTNVTIRAPRAVNVDVGRNSAAMLAELAQGATNYELIYAPLGLDWQDEFLKLKQQQDFAKQIGLILPESALSGSGAGVGEPGAENKSPIDALKTEKDAYGVGVRAGAITPTPEDEKFFRSKAGLPELTQDATSAWSEDGNVRRPITLAGKDGSLGDQQITPIEE